jgi:cephalosporin hydroxylase
MNRTELVAQIVSNIENGVFVEIGTHNGEFADVILSNSTNSVLYCIDPYISYNDYKDSINTYTGDHIFESAYEMLTQKYGTERVKFVRKMSSDAANDVPDKIDFLYIDGNHSYKYVLQDLELYAPKVKQNCYIVGDDAVDLDESARNAEGDVTREWCPGCYGDYGIIKAFGEYCNSYNLTGEIVGNQYVVLKNN